MPTVSSAYAAWLQSPARYSIGTVAGASAKWGDKAVTTTIVSSIADQADADTESARQSAFLAGPIARDKCVVKGHRSDLIGRVVTITGDRMGYAGGRDVFVIGVNELEATTELTVLVRL